MKDYFEKLVKVIFDSIIPDSMCEILSLKFYSTITMFFFLINRSHMHKLSLQRKRILPAGYGMIILMLQEFFLRGTID